MPIKAKDTDDSETESESSEESSTELEDSDSESSSSETQTSSDDSTQEIKKKIPISSTIIEAKTRNISLAKPKEDKKDLKIKRLKPGEKKRLTICLTNCRYEIVRGVAKSFGLYEVPQDKIWDIFWTDFSISLARAIDMKNFQIVNHFPGMNEICRKDLLSKNLNRMKKLFPGDYDIFPKTWCLPSEMGELQAYGATWKNKTFICKPEMGCQGKGIFLVRNLKDLNPFGRIICQVYISKPFLIDGLKFDLRVYVLITSCDPLRIYVYNEGLARFATSKYKPPTNNNTDNSYMHLTNYSVNKFSRDYVIDEEFGTKRKLTSLYNWFRTYNYEADLLIQSIDDVIIKTIISAQPILRHNYKKCYHSHDRSSACFEILGFDILFDHKLKPFVLEVNHSPSFHTDSKMDSEIKENLIRDTFRIINLKEMYMNKFEHFDKEKIQDLKGEERKRAQIARAEVQQEYELENCGEYRLAYPTLKIPDKYSKYFDQHIHPITDLGAPNTNSSNNSLQGFKNGTLEDANKRREEEKRKRVLATVLPGAGVAALNKLMEDSQDSVDNNDEEIKENPETVRVIEIGDFSQEPVPYTQATMLTPNEVEVKNAVMLANLKEAEKEEKLLANEKLEEERKKAVKRRKPKMKKKTEKKEVKKSQPKGNKSVSHIEKNSFGPPKLPYPTVSSLNTIPPDMNLASHNPKPPIVAEEKKEIPSPFIVMPTAASDTNLTSPKSKLSKSKTSIDIAKARGKFVNKNQESKPKKSKRKLAVQKSQQFSVSNWKSTQDQIFSYELANKLTSLPTILNRNDGTDLPTEIPQGDSLTVEEEKKTMEKIFTHEIIETHYEASTREEKAEPVIVKRDRISDNDEPYLGGQAEKNLTKVWSAYGSTFGNTSVTTDGLIPDQDQNLISQIPPPEEPEIIHEIEQDFKDFKPLSQEIIAYQERAYIEWTQSEEANKKKKHTAQLLLAKKQAAASQHDLNRLNIERRVSMSDRVSNYSNQIEDQDEFERMKELRRRAMYIKSRGIESTSLMVLAKAGLLKTKDSRRFRKLYSTGIVNPTRIRGGRPVPRETNVNEEF